MSKPRILIAMHYMELGGAESALLGLLQSIDPQRADVDVFVHDHRGPLMQYIPTDKVRLLPEVGAYSMLERPLFETVRKGHPLVALARVLGKIEARLTRGNEIVTQQHWTAKVLPMISREVYDVAISFVTPHYIGVECVRAKKKVGWIHTDYTCIQVNRARELKMWQKLDTIVSISSDVTSTFLQVFPSLTGRVVEIENILNSDFIRSRSEECLPMDEGFGTKGVTLLSVGRICEAKNYDNVPFIAARMKDLGAQFHWYIIGPGDHSDIDRTIDETGTEDCVTFLGPRDNPYPYIKACDIYVQPSRYEGNSVTVREAQILRKPVVITSYPTAPSQVKDGVDGVVVPLDNRGCAEGLAQVINDMALQNKIIGHLHCHDYGNVREIDNFYEIIK